MDAHQHHEELVSGLYGELKDIMDDSDQAMYIYLDDNHKACNRRFASLLGYMKKEDWDKNTESFTTYVAEKSQKTIVGAYQNAMEHFVGSCIKVTWKKKNGDLVNTEVILVPMEYKKHMFALHFITVL